MAFYYTIIRTLSFDNMNLFVKALYLENKIIKILK